MIIGTGIDILEISRIEKLRSEAFYKKVFTSNEIEYLKNKGPESTAGYFCAKEAIAKALGTGFRGFQFSDLEIKKTKEGAPYVVLHGKAKELASEKGIIKIMLTISHSKTTATAMAIAEDQNNDKETEVDFYPINKIKTRRKDSHKGEYGNVHIIGGCNEMSGAVILCAKGALRTGAGLVTCVVPNCILDRVGANVVEATYKVCNTKNGFIDITMHELQDTIEKASVVAFGVGIGTYEGLEKSLEYIIQNSNKPVIIDADGLKLLKTIKESLRNAKAPIILTPHLGEMSILTGLSINEINANKEGIAFEFAKKYGIILLLKGNETIVTDGEMLYINKTGNPGMATGGSGDVLTGVIAALLAQKYMTFDAVALGAYLHGRAGDLAYDKYGYGLVAGDLIENLGELLRGK